MEMKSVISFRLGEKDRHLPCLPSCCFPSLLLHHLYQVYCPRERKEPGRRKTQILPLQLVLTFRIVEGYGFSKQQQTRIDFIIYINVPSHALSTLIS